MQKRSYTASVFQTIIQIFLIEFYTTFDILFCSYLLQFLAY